MKISWPGVAAVAVLALLAGCGVREGFEAGQPGVKVAEAALSGGTPQVALQVVSGILAQNPNNIAALNVQGDAFTALGKYDEAAASFSHALRDDSHSARAHVGLGRLRLATDPAAAERMFLEALKYEPRNTTAMNNLGIARDLLGRHREAQMAYSQALGINPDMAAARVNMALSLAMSGDSERAQQLLGPMATEIGATRKLRHDYAAVLVMAGKRAEAQKILSVDLSPAEVQEAMDGFAAARVQGGTGKPAE